MDFNLYNHLDKLEELAQNDPEQSTTPIEYDNTLLKEMANDIKSAQKQLESKIDTMMKENATSGKNASRIAVWTLVVAVLTLIVTIAGIVINFL